ncbi:MAG: hypothetical protein PHF12_07885, partial [Candidatus Omnitrophica bacterium]|nr:hypothetical protein [Candidatus Omnitrophota bacterium]
EAGIPLQSSPMFCYNIAMTENTLFYRCLALSAIIHAGLLSVLPNRILTYAPTQRPIEVAYVQSFGQEKEKADISPEPVAPKERRQMPPQQISTSEDSKNILKDFLKTEIFQPEQKTDLSAQMDPTAQNPKKKSVQTPNIPGETFNSPEYKNYYQIVREKIRRQAYRNYRYIQEGEVFLTFTLARSGGLKEVHVDSAKSVEDEYLRRIALESVQQSSPFPEFPIKLQDKEQLAFNVIISFELK